MATASTNGKPGAPEQGPGKPIRARGFPYGPQVPWPGWTAPAALVGAFALALLGSALADIPAALAGVRVSSSHLPGSLVIADTAIQDIAFVAAAVIFAQLGGHRFHTYDLGLRPPRIGVRRAALLVVGTYLAFLAFSYAWAVVLGITEKEKILESLGTNEGTALLAAGAVLTCLIAPICEEIIFRGFFFRALANWRGALPAALITGIVFGAVHAGSAPVADLLPLGVLGLLLCLLYRATGSLYLTISVHVINNALAFGDLEGWAWWQVLGLPALALAVLYLVYRLLLGVGVLATEPKPTAQAAAGALEA
ncbi:MAG TPA: CPBP family intramembrane glutamic endopeptidase [Solirubrobacteraceae bacterium]|nr:CPBP family intramembrane glutamic endopeptidase [Solirubrobacteraceae bacterium]